METEVAPSLGKGGEFQPHLEIAKDVGSNLSPSVVVVVVKQFFIVVLRLKGNLSCVHHYTLMSLFL